MIKTKYLSGQEYLTSKTQKKMRELVRYQSNEFKSSLECNDTCPRCGELIDVLDDSEVDHTNPFRNIAGQFIDIYTNILGGTESEFYQSMKFVLDYFLHDYCIRSRDVIQKMHLHSRGSKEIEDVLHWVQFHEAASSFSLMHKECHRAKSKEEQR